MSDSSEVCREQSCERVSWARGFCSRCYHRKRADGSLEPANAPYAARLAGDVDQVVIDRLIAGVCPMRVTSFERREAARRLVAGGMPKKTAARRLGVDQTQVRRDLARTAA